MKRMSNETERQKLADGAFCDPMAPERAPARRHARDLCILWVIRDITE
jgi:hypothetical protein